MLTRLWKLNCIGRRFLTDLLTSHHHSQNTTCALQNHQIDHRPQGHAIHRKPVPITSTATSIATTRQGWVVLIVIATRRICRHVFYCTMKSEGAMFYGRRRGARNKTDALNVSLNVTLLALFCQCTEAHGGTISDWDRVHSLSLLLTNLRVQSSC